MVFVPCAGQMAVDKTGYIGIRFAIKLFGKFETETWYEGKEFNIAVLDANGKKYTFNGKVPNVIDRISITTNKKKFLSLLKSGEIIKVSVTPKYSAGKENYLFTIDTCGFKKLYEELK